MAHIKKKKNLKGKKMALDPKTFRGYLSRFLICCQQSKRCKQVSNTKVLHLLKAHPTFKTIYEDTTVTQESTCP